MILKDISEPDADLNGDPRWGLRLFYDGKEAGVGNRHLLRTGITGHRFIRLRMRSGRFTHEQGLLERRHCPEIAEAPPLSCPGIQGALLRRLEGGAGLPGQARQ
ncbi:hypothetical protein ACN6KF_000018 [Labrys sp. La1]|uniref:hypothetical protein n=1 Tax=Labrys sp. La1 TaxID=3404917 RepID=UPI003EBC18D1